MHHRKDRKPSKQKQAQERQDAWDKTSARDKIKSLDDRLGPGVGAVKQRKRLEEELRKSQ